MTSGNPFLELLDYLSFELSQESFEQTSLIEKGYACFVFYKRADSHVEFLYGPPEYQVEMIIHTRKGKFAFKDLLQISSIHSWVNKNRYVQNGGKDLKDEARWFIELLKESLPSIV